MDKIFEMIQKCRPVIHCITNPVTINDCANAVLALGGSPIMAHHPAEAAEITAGAGALVCNLGATYDYEAMRLSVTAANQKGIPVVLDPVGVAASTYRRTFALELLKQHQISCIRGNYSEIVALLRACGTGAGLDNKLVAEELPKTEIQAYACEHKMIILASGKTDFIFGDPEGTIYEITAGDPMMSRITGAGCMLSVLVATVLAAECTAEAVAKLCQYYGDCGSEAASKTRAEEGGTQTFRLHLIDEVSKH